MDHRLWSFVVLLVVALLHGACGQQDLTVQPGATGQQVVEAVCDRISSSCIFPEDKLFTRRLAYVESTDGQDPKTFRPGYYGGIWQCDQAFFDLTHDSTVSYVLLEYIKDIQTAFGIDWPSVAWTELDKPLYSALCARLYIQYQSRNEPNGIPRDISAQSTFWQRHYRPSGDVNYFVERATALEESCKSVVGPDIVFVLDASGSVGSSNFQKVKEFARSVVGNFDVGTGTNQAKIAVVKYSSSVTREFDLLRYSTTSEVQNAIDRISYSGGGTNTHLALDEMTQKAFKESNGARPKNAGHPRVGIVVTDGKSNEPSKTVVSALAAHDADITVFAVGVGSNVDLNELEVIASDPVCYHLFLLANFSEFQSLTDQILKKTCDAPIIIGPENNHTVTQLPAGEDQNCKIKVPSQGVTIKVTTAGGGQSTFYVSKSTYPSPSFYEAKTISKHDRLGVLYVAQPPTADAEGIVFCNIEGDNHTNSNISIDVSPGDEDHCDERPCGVNGECIDTGSKYTCHCIGGYTGDHCQTPPNPCLNNPCNSGVCEPKSSAKRRRTIDDGGYICHCPPGFTGKHCESVVSNPCNTHVCENGGLCIDTGHLPTCDCKIGFTGERCETNVDECASNPCIAGQCSDKVNGYTCHCDPGFTGHDCNVPIDECTSNPCSHGDCKPLHNRYECCCEQGWTGKHCDSEIDECASNPCVHGECKDDVGKYVCRCPPGYTGHHCEIDIDECESNPCVNGDCEDLIDGYVCNCLPGYTGTNCEIDIDECESNPCVHGECFDQINGYRCECPLGYTGPHCETDVDECVSGPCIHGNCEDKVNGYICHCPPGWTGPLCDTDIDECSSDPCVEGACHDGTNDYDCTCFSGYTGDNCEIDVDECLSNPCVHGECTDQVNGYVCVCDSGYTGINCDSDIDECSSDPCEHGDCNDDINRFQCTCDAGYTGDLCQTDIDECESSPCVHGECKDKVNGYQCECQPGYTGTNCETDIDECASTPCIHGTCMDEVNAYQCICHDGFTGTRCETDIDECESNPCVHGECSDGINDYDCECDEGYNGENCDTDIDECQSQPCVNGGTCHDRVDYFECVCPDGYTGDRCETDIDECSSNPCQHGQCVDGINMYTCICDPGYIGTLCDCG